MLERPTCVQDVALLTIMVNGNDYLPSLPLNVAHGPNATNTYLQMRASATWRNRSLLVVDRGRRILGMLPRTCLLTTLLRRFNYPVANSAAQRTF